MVPLIETELANGLVKVLEAVTLLAAEPVPNTSTSSPAAYAGPLLLVDDET
jgi:hypothetical protein